MFGMLDYRAYKLAFLLFGLPAFVLKWIWVFGSPLLVYLITYSQLENPILRFISALLLQFVFELVIATFLIGIIRKIFKAIFSWLVDIEPSDGRTQEQAQAVAWGGMVATRHLEMAKHPTEWRREIVFDLPTNDWLQNLLYGRVVRARLQLVHKRYEELGDKFPYNQDVVRKMLNDGGIQSPSSIEKVLSSSEYRLGVLMYLWLAYLLVFNPLNI